MALKTKNPPPIPEQSPALSEERILRINPEIDRRLDGFMQANTKLTDYYTNLVKQNPDRAIRAFMLTKMFRHEAELRVVSRQAPQAKEWLEQSPNGSIKSARSIARRRLSASSPRRRRSSTSLRGLDKAWQLSKARRERRARQEKVVLPSRHSRSGWLLAKRTGLRPLPRQSPNLFTWKPCPLSMSALIQSHERGSNRSLTS